MYDFRSAILKALNSGKKACLLIAGKMIFPAKT